MAPRHPDSQSRARRVVGLALTTLFVALGIALWLWPQDTEPPTNAATSPKRQAENLPSTIASQAPRTTRATRAHGDPRIDAPSADPSPEDPGNASITIRLIHPETKRPIRHAIGQAVGPWSPLGTARRRVASTDEKRRLVFDRLAAGTWTLTFDRLHAEDWPMRIEVKADQHVQKDVLLDEGRETVVKVLLPDGSPAPGATIWLRANAYPQFVAAACATDAAGEARLQRYSNRAAIGASLHPYGPTEFHRPIVAAQDDQPHRLTLQLGAAGASLRGMVVTAHGQPVAEALVGLGSERLIMRSGTPVWQCPPADIKTDRFGAFEWNGLRVGPTDVSVRRDGYAPVGVHVELRPGPNEARIELAEVDAYVLRVVDSTDQPLAGAMVMLDGLSAHAGSRGTTDDEGRCRLTAVPASPFALHVHLASYRSARVLVPASDQRPNTERRVVLRTFPGVRGVLVDDQDRPLEGWSLCWAPDAGQAKTNAEGRFELHTNRTEAGYLFVRDTRRGPWTRCDWLGPVHPVPDDERAAAELRIRWPSPKTGVLRGAIAGHQAAPYPLRSIRIDQLGLSSVPQHVGYARVEDGAAGQFFTRPLAAGRYILRVWPEVEQALQLPELSLGPFEVTAGVDHDLGTILAPQPGLLAFRLHRSDGVELENAVAFVTSNHPSPIEKQRRGEFSLQPSPDGWFRKALLPGRYEVALHSNNATWHYEEVTIRSGTTTQLERSAEPAERRRLRFPVPVPDAVATARSLDFTIRDSLGRVICRDSAYSARDLPIQYVPALVAGTYTLELLVNGSERFAGRFVAPAHGRSSLALAIAVAPVR